MLHGVFFVPVVAIINNVNVSVAFSNGSLVICQVSPGTGANHQVRLLLGEEGCTSDISSTWSYLLETFTKGEKRVYNR